jgi:hypothetical protein
MREAAANLAHQAKIREAQEYLRQQNTQKQQHLGLAHPPQPQYAPQPPPPPPPAPAPAPLQGVSSPKKRGFAEMAKGDSRDGALCASVQQPQLSCAEAAQEPRRESAALQADGKRYALSAAADSCVFEDKSGQETLPTPGCATPSVTALPVLDAPGAKGVARVKQSQFVGICRGTHIYMHARTRTL